MTQNGGQPVAVMAGKQLNWHVQKYIAESREKKMSKIKLSRGKNQSKGKIINEVRTSCCCESYGGPNWTKGHQINVWSAKPVKRYTKR